MRARKLSTARLGPTYKNRRYLSMDPKQSFILAMKVLALMSSVGAALVVIFSEAEDKHERIVSLLLSSIACSLIALSL